MRWRRFSRSPYASFLSLHRCISIGVITAAMVVASETKAVQNHSDIAIASPSASLESDDDSSMAIALGDVTVTASRIPLTAIEAPRMVTVMQRADLAAAAVQSVNDVLNLAVGVDVRQRGDMGVQTDISVRGGTFDQITILLNGINISSPHTGHLSADFPLSVNDIERIEVIEGPAARVFGTSAFTGVINIVTRHEEGTKFGGSAVARAGSYGTFGGDLRLLTSHRVGKSSTMSHRISGGYSQSDGATPNSYFKNGRAFYQGDLQSGNTSVDWQVGYSYKPYGANTFYGAASTDQWESNERWMAAVRAQSSAGAFHFAPQVYWNRWNDHYQWHKGSPAGENFHQVDTYGLALNSWLESKLGKTSLGVEMRSDGIWSTKLGKVLPEDQWRPTAGIDRDPNVKYKAKDQRTNLSAYFEHLLLLKQWSLSAGVLANYNTGLDARWRFYPGVDIAFRPSADWKLFASWNMALRMPTFTDLYYSGTGIEGNSNLRPEKTNDVNLGAKFRRNGWNIDLQTFYSHKTDLIDWVVYAGDETGTFRSGNFTLDNAGVEVNAQFLPREIWGKRSPVRRIAVQYAYIHEDITYPSNVVRSKYAMEYLRHKIVISADGRLWRNLNLSLSWRYCDRVGEDNKPYNLLDGRLSWDDTRWAVWVDGTNILNKSYFDYSFVPQPGRQVMAGASLKF